MHLVFFLFRKSPLNTKLDDEGPFTVAAFLARRPSCAVIKVQARLGLASKPAPDLNPSMLNEVIVTIERATFGIGIALLGIGLAFRFGAWRCVRDEAQS
jgi:hypothetical protein